MTDPDPDDLVQTRRSVRASLHKIATDDQPLYEDLFLLCYLRGPDGLIVALVDGLS